jgi:hypothetical protein
VVPPPLLLLLLPLPLYLLLLRGNVQDNLLSTLF